MTNPYRLQETPEQTAGDIMEALIDLDRQLRAHGLIQPPAPTRVH